MIFRRYDVLGLATTPLIEGQNPAGRLLTKVDLAATLQQYGDFVESTDFVMDTQPDPVTTEAVSLLGQQMGETFDQLYRDVYADATNIVYANGSATNQVTQIVDKDDLDRAYRLLRNNKAKPFTPMILAGQNVGTAPIMPAYWALVDEDVAFDLRHLEGFVIPSEYAKQTGVLMGEIGADKNGIRFLASPNGYVLAGASGVTAAGTDVKNTGGFVDVYSIFIVGQDAVGGINLAQRNGGVIRKGLGSAGTADPLDMRATVGWKKWDTRLILNPNFMVELQTCASL
jgi:N4-gp56 family major capsid protein